MRLEKDRAQNLVEYTLILGIVTVALLGMQTYFKRGIQSMVKTVADDYGSQGDAIGNLEIAIKRRIYGQEGKNLTNLTTNGSWNQKIENRGEGSIRTEVSGVNTLTGSSVWVGGDYRTRRLQEVKGTPPSSPSN